MAPEIIVQRRAPTYDFVVTRKIEPDSALAVLEALFARDPAIRFTRASHSRESQHFVEARPSRFWSIHPIVTARIVPSVAGSNTYVQVGIQAFWWALIFALEALLLLAGQLSHSLKEILVGFLLVLVIVVLAAISCSVLRAKRMAISALSNGEEQAPGGRDSVATIQARIIASALVATLIVTGVVARRGYLRHRDRLLALADFPVGASREAVIARLGKPDLEMVGDELRRVATLSNRTCANRATRELDYFGSLSRGLYCLVYLDREDRVICVEHGILLNFLQSIRRAIYADALSSPRRRDRATTRQGAFNSLPRSTSPPGSSPMSAGQHAGRKGGASHRRPLDGQGAIN